MLATVLSFLLVMGTVAPVFALGGGGATSSPSLALDDTPPAIATPNNTQEAPANRTADAYQTLVSLQASAASDGTDLQPTIDTINQSYSRYRDAHRVTSAQLYADHSQTHSLLTQQLTPNTSTPINTVSKQLLWADRDTAHLVIDDVKRVIDQFEQANRSVTQDVRDDLALAKQHYANASTTANASLNASRVLSDRLNDREVATTQYEAAWTAAQQALSELDAERVPDVTILTRSDPHWDSSTNHQSRVIIGVVSDVRVDDYDSVTLTLSSGTSTTVPLTTSTAPGTTGSFSANLTFTESRTALTATVVNTETNESAVGTVHYDSDGLPDTYEEETTGTDPFDPDSNSTRTTVIEGSNGTLDGAEDFDADGLNATVEWQLGSDSFTNDTDGDGLSDGFEALKTGTDPTQSDTNGDGSVDASADPDNDSLSNLQEQAVGTHPATNDTDGDGLTDAFELNTTNTDPLLNNSDSAVTAANESNTSMIDGGEDFDDDGVIAYYEQQHGTSPFSNDTDADGLTDLFELQSGTDPLLADSDNDSVSDLDEDLDGDGLTNAREQRLGTSGRYNDTDGDGLRDDVEVDDLGSDPTAFDSDGDWLSDETETRLGTNLTTVDSDMDGVDDVNETYTTSHSNASIGATLVASGQGATSLQPTLSDGDAPGFNISTLDAARGSSYVAVSEVGSLTNSTLTLSYEWNSTAADEASLGLFRYNATRQAFEEVTATQNTTANTVTGDVSKSGIYVVFSASLLANRSNSSVNEWVTSDSFENSSSQCVGACTIDSSEGTSTSTTTSDSSGPSLSGGSGDGPTVQPECFTPGPGSDCDADNDGVNNAADDCPGTYGSGSDGCPVDSDGDGIDNPDDSCDYLSGPSSNYGCPYDDSDNDGVVDPDDDCQTTFGYGSDGCPVDSDGDGIDDQDDDCRTTSGPAGNGGCPYDDSDNDGVEDPYDDCDYQDGPASNDGCPYEDSDGDGIDDRYDHCDYQDGPASNDGCPYDDSDDDGVKDPYDDCPANPGEGADGCPTDTDGDGFYDKRDSCPNEEGPVSTNGCPVDSDSDGVYDHDDYCDEQPGPASNDGCPTSDEGGSSSDDSDGDGISDDNDACPRTPGDGAYGCPDSSGGGSDGDGSTDTDGDGVTDDKDNCPSTSGDTYDGCLSSNSRSLNTFDLPQTPEQLDFQIDGTAIVNQDSASIRFYVESSSGTTTLKEISGVGDTYENEISIERDLSGQVSGATTIYVEVTGDAEFTLNEQSHRLDTDGDGLTDATETGGFQSGIIAGTNVGVIHTDPYRVDTDGDGLSDGDEVFKSNYGSNGPYIQLLSHPAKADADKDGLLDDDEKVWGTNPFAADTDGDGHNDLVDERPHIEDVPPDVNVFTGDINEAILHAKDESGLESVTLTAQFGDETETIEPHEVQPSPTYTIFYMDVPSRGLFNDIHPDSYTVEAVDNNGNAVTFEMDKSEGDLFSPTTAKLSNVAVIGGVANSAKPVLDLNALGKAGKRVSILFAGAMIYKHATTTYSGGNVVDRTVSELSPVPATGGQTIQLPGANRVPGTIQFPSGSLYEAPGTVDNGHDRLFGREDVLRLPGINSVTDVEEILRAPNVVEDYGDYTRVIGDNPSGPGDIALDLLKGTLVSAAAAPTDPQGRSQEVTDKVLDKLLNDRDDWDHNQLGNSREEILNNLQKIVTQPDEIYEDIDINRFMYVKKMELNGDEVTVVLFAVDGEIVTSFVPTVDGVEGLEGHTREYIDKYLRIQEMEKVWEGENPILPDVNIGDVTEAPEESKS